MTAVDTKSMCDLCALYKNGFCEYDNVTKPQPITVCAAQVLTEHGWIESGFAIMESGEKIKLSS